MPKRKRALTADIFREILGKRLHIPGYVFTDGLPRAVRVTRRDASHRQCVDLRTDDGVLYYFPAADVKQWIDAEHEGGGACEAYEAYPEDLEVNGEPGGRSVSQVSETGAEEQAGEDAPDAISPEEEEIVDILQHTQSGQNRFGEAWTHDSPVECVPLRQRPPDCAKDAAGKLVSKNRKTGRKAGRRPKQYAELVGAKVNVPVWIWDVDVPEMFYRGTVRGKDKTHPGCVEVKMEDGVTYYFPVDRVRQWIAENTRRDGGTVGAAGDAYAAETLTAMSLSTGTDECDGVSNPLVYNPNVPGLQWDEPRTPISIPTVGAEAPADVTAPLPWQQNMQTRAADDWQVEL